MALECGCPEHFPDWDGQDIDLGGQLILNLPIATFLHMPMGHEVYLGRMRQILTDLELKQTWPGFYLTRTGWMKGQLMTPLEETITPSRHVTRLERPYNVHVALHKGGMGTIKDTVRKVQATLLDSGRMPKDLLLSYLTCPNCSEKRGGEMVMLLRRWETSSRLSKRIEARNNR